MACDLRLNAEGKLDFRNNKKRIEKKKGRREKKNTGDTEASHHVSIDAFFSSYLSLSFPLFSFIFYTEKIDVSLSLPYCIDNPSRDSRFTLY